MDISKITNEITQLRRETEDEIITPEYLGEVLQDIADALKSGVETNAADIATNTGDLSEVRLWVKRNRTLGAVNDSRSGNVFLTLTQETLSGGTSSLTATLTPATAVSPGIMSPRQVALLDTALQPDDTGRLPIYRQWPGVLRFRKTYDGTNDPTHTIIPVPTDSLGSVGPDTDSTNHYVMFDVALRRFIHVDEAESIDNTTYPATTKVTESRASRWEDCEAWGELTSSGVKPRKDCLYYCVETNKLMLYVDGNSFMGESFEGLVSLGG